MRGHSRLQGLQGTRRQDRSLRGGRGRGSEGRRWAPGRCDCLALALWGTQTAVGALPYPAPFPPLTQFKSIQFNKHLLNVSRDSSFLLEALHSFSSPQTLPSTTLLTLAPWGL